MSRSGYSEGECDSPEAQWALIRWRGAVRSAFRGGRGQAFLREMLPVDYDPGEVTGEDILCDAALRIVTRCPG